MNASLAIWLCLWVLLISAMRAVMATTHLPRVWRMPPASLASSVALMLADKGLQVFGEGLTITQAPMRPYLICWVLLSAALTVYSMTNTTWKHIEARKP